MYIIIYIRYTITYIIKTKVSAAVLRSILRRDWGSDPVQPCTLRNNLGDP